MSAPNRHYGRSNLVFKDCANLMEFFVEYKANNKKAQKMLHNSIILVRTRENNYFCTLKRQSE